MKTLDFNNDSILYEYEDRTLLIRIVLLDNSIQVVFTTVKTYNIKEHTR
jgi:hypothetical protein